MASPTTDASIASAQDKALAFICAKEFHRCLWLPEIQDHGKLRVTFATTRNFDDGSLPALLFVGPMFGSRYNCIDIDHLASECGVRVICVDRPGMGGSTPVPLKIRIKTWIQTVPALLKKLNVDHVSLFSHSAGTMYAMNMLVHLRSILDPKAPYMGFMAPFVANDQSDATLVNFLTKLPTSWVDSWSSLNKFINTKIMPVASFSGGLFSASASLFNPPASTDVPGAESTSDADLAQKYGVDVELAKAIDETYSKFVFAEDTTAANEDAKLCLRKAEDADWDAAADYMDCVRRILEAEKFRREQAPDAPKLRVEGLFASSDVMSGKKGQEYFEQCWRQDGVSDQILFVSKTYEETNHDSVIIDRKKGALRDVFEAVAKTGRSI